MRIIEKIERRGERKVREKGEKGERERCVDMFVPMAKFPSPAVGL